MRGSNLWRCIYNGRVIYPQRCGLDVHTPREPLPEGIVGVPDRQAGGRDYLCEPVLGVVRIGGHVLQRVLDCGDLASVVVGIRGEVPCGSRMERRLPAA